MQRTYCDRCDKELTLVYDVTVAKVGRPVTTRLPEDAVDYELCVSCVSKLRSFLRRLTPVLPGSVTVTTTQTDEGSS